jgi:hypothetical protein
MCKKRQKRYDILCTEGSTQYMRSRYNTSAEYKAHVHVVCAHDFGRRFCLPGGTNQQVEHVFVGCDWQDDRTTSPGYAACLFSYFPTSPSFFLSSSLTCLMTRCPVQRLTRAFPTSEDHVWPPGETGMVWEAKGDGGREGGCKSM